MRQTAKKQNQNCDFLLIFMALDFTTRRAAGEMENISLSLPFDDAPGRIIAGEEIIYILGCCFANFMLLCIFNDDCRFCSPLVMSLVTFAGPHVTSFNCGLITQPMIAEIRLF